MIDYHQNSVQKAMKDDEKKEVHHDKIIRDASQDMLKMDTLKNEKPMKEL